MTVTVLANGTLIATGTVENTLTNVSTQGAFQLIVDKNAMIAGDGIELRAKQTVLTGGTLRVVEYAGYWGAQPADDMIAFSSIFANELSDSQSLSFTLKLSAGTGSRSFPWKVMNIEDTVFYSSYVSGTLPANVTQIDGVANANHASGEFPSDIRYISGTAINPVVSQLGVTTITNNDKTGYSLSSPQNFNLIGNITGSIQGNIVQVITGSAGSDPWSTSLPGAYSAGQAGNILGNRLDVLVSSRMASGTVVVATNNDKTGYTVSTVQDKSGYSLSSPQSFNLIGNVSGTLTNVINVLNPGSIGVSGTVIVSQNNDKTGYSLSNPQNWNLIGNISGSITSVTNQVSTLDPWLTALPGAYGGGTAGNIVGNNLNAKITSRQPSGTVVVATNNDKSGYNLSSPQNYDRIGNTSGTMTAVYNVISGTTSNAPTLSQIVNGVWDEQIGAHQITGSTGKTLSGAGSAGDPWLTPLPGTYTVGEAGNIVGTRLDVLVSSRQPSGTSSSGPTVQQIVNGVWDEQNSSHLITGSMGESLENASQIGFFSGSTPALIWSYSPRTLTTPSGGAVPPPSTPAAIYAYRGDTFILSLTGLGSLVNLSKLYFTVKQNVGDPDTESIIQIEKTAGLIYLNEAPAGTPANGSIAINNIPTGDITIMLAAVEMAKLDLVNNLFYDIEIVRTSGTTVSTLQSGVFNVVADVTKATS